jgi:hypothetical protein
MYDTGNASCHTCVNTREAGGAPYSGTQKGPTPSLDITDNVLLSFASLASESFGFFNLFHAKYEMHTKKLRVRMNTGIGGLSNDHVYM